MLGCLATIGGGILAVFLILAFLFLGVNSTVTQEIMLPPAIEVQPTYVLPTIVPTATIVRPTQAPTATLVVPTRVPTQDLPTAIPTEAASTFESHYTGIEQSFTAEGFPRLGDPDAPIVVEYYSSFGCSHCKILYHEQLLPNLEHVRSGDVQFVFHPITFIANNANNDAVNAARAALCAGEQGNFWDMHDLMFEWQGTVAINSERASQAVLEIGLDVDLFMDCYLSNETDVVVATAERAFRDHEFVGTPTVFVSGVEVGYPSITQEIEARLED